MWTMRLGWAIVAGGVLAVALGVALRRPVLILGAAGVWSWVFARRMAFARTAADVATRLSASSTIASETPRATVETALETKVDLEPPSRMRVDVAQRLPAKVVAESGVSVATLVPGETSTTERLPIRFPTGGVERFDSPVAIVSDERDVWTAFHVGEGYTVNVSPRRPEAMFDASTPAFRAPFTSNPSSLRRYTPTDPANRIDWKVTSRLREAHVREYESEGFGQTVLFIEHGGATDRGVPPAGVTLLRHLQDAALGLVEALSETAQGVGLVAIDDEGPTTAIEPRASSRNYADVRRALRSLEPSGEGNTATGGGVPDLDVSGRTRSSLEGESSQFASRLRPFLADGLGHSERLAAHPLSRAVRTHTTTVPEQTRYVLLTAGVDRGAIRAAVEQLQRSGAPVFVLLPPDASFDSVETDVHVPAREGAAAVLDQATVRARRETARQFRQSLGAMNGVTAVTVAPTDVESTTPLSVETRGVRDR
jgi:uncharacterized protein (DUF58 family)